MNFQIRAIMRKNPSTRIASNELILVPKPFISPYLQRTLLRSKVVYSIKSELPLISISEGNEEVSEISMTDKTADDSKSIVRSLSQRLWVPPIETMSQAFWEVVLHMSTICSWRGQREDEKKLLVPWKSSYGQKSGRPESFPGAFSRPPNAGRCYWENSKMKIIWQPDQTCEFSPIKSHTSSWSNFL